MSRYQPTRGKGPCEGCEERLEAAERRVAELEQEYQGIMAQEEIWIEPRVKQSRKEAMMANEKLDRAEATLAAVREWAEENENRQEPGPYADAILTILDGEGEK